jgi:osmoprotectant transport system ATP-binding protein
VIRVENVSKYYGAALAVDNISFDVNEGENFVLLGTSGCGKTTTLRMLNRLVGYSSGRIAINGKDINSQNSEILRRNIGYVLQHNALFPHYTVAENIAIVPNLLKWDKKRIAGRTTILMEKLKLPVNYLHKYPNQLSGGQQQRVNIARALAAEPDILLMDEPFGALDPLTRADIVREFLELDELKRKTNVIVTHDVLEAFELGDTICLMERGGIVQTGKPKDLLFAPASDFVKSFLEKHYLELLLKEVAVADIWHDLASVADVNMGMPSINAKCSIWDVIEQFSKKDIKQIRIENAMSKETKIVSMGEIFAAYSRYKQE